MLCGLEKGRAAVAILRAYICPSCCVPLPFFVSYSCTKGESNGNPLQYSCLEYPMDRGAWWVSVHGVAKSWTRLSDFTFTFHFHVLGKEMATHSSVLAWRIPGTGEPGGLLAMGSHRVGHDWSDLAAAASTPSVQFSSVQFSRSIQFPSALPKK